MKKYKLFSLLIAVCLTFSSMSCYVSADTTQEILYKGDIDLDSSITAADALLVLKHAAKLDEVNTLIADIDEDTTVNANDALYILKFAAKLITEFPGGNTVNSGNAEATPEPTDTATPIPSESVSPAPTESASPEPTESTSPMPTESTSPAPTESASPEPTESTSPAPTESASPEPTESTSPDPTATPTPTPTLTPIESVKEYVKTNGFNGENGERIYGYSYEDDTVKATISYIPAEDKLVFALNYEENTDVETMSVAIFMDYHESFDSTTLEVRYAYGDFNQSYVAQAPVVPEEITAETKYEFKEVSSENCSDDEKEAILSIGDMYMETALYLWDSILTSDMALSLADFGFTSYNAGTVVSEKLPFSFTIR